MKTEILKCKINEAKSACIYCAILRNQKVVEGCFMQRGLKPLHKHGPSSFIIFMGRSVGAGTANKKQSRNGYSEKIERIGEHSAPLLNFDRSYAGQGTTRSKDLRLALLT